MKRNDFILSTVQMMITANIRKGNYVNMPEIVRDATVAADKCGDLFEDSFLHKRNEYVVKKQC